jgi:serine/threonine protein phosphatase 1
MFSQIKSYFRDNDYHDKQSHHYLIVPDLHGTHSLYKKVETYIKEHVEKSRTIIFLGDYMDRGESGNYHDRVFKDVGSYLVLRDIISLQKWAEKESRSVIFLRGNHELFYEDYFIHDKKYAYEEYGFFKDSIDCLKYVFEQEGKFYDEFIDFLKTLQPYYIDKKYHYLFIHAGIDPDEKDLEKQVEEGLVYWIRDKFLFSEKKLPYTVVFGHTPFSKPFMRSDKIGLDSGVYKRGFINLLKIDHENSKVIQLYK